ncbi:hypothetical protein CAEBREN_15632 [Caenorhabditis brenneri]|uniref:Uncharacterized protein n=1 Tax=Caenorhabditis brenneri TaxID=135651 RepID=G0P4V8_CAEBE|nr:hypothetical protein CAEBREN_15632 [Caenorhabditis brenneri]
MLLFNWQLYTENRLEECKTDKNHAIIIPTAASTAKRNLSIGIFTSASSVSSTLRSIFSERFLRCSESSDFTYMLMNLKKCLELVVSPGAGSGITDGFLDRFPAFKVKSRTKLACDCIIPNIDVIIFATGASSDSVFTSSSSSIFAVKLLSLLGGVILGVASETTTQSSSLISRISGVLNRFLLAAS